jgi:hypothetical protein
MTYESPKLTRLGKVQQVIKGAGHFLLDADNQTPMD